jgi:hypothetical protein
MITLSVSPPAQRRGRNPAQEARKSTQETLVSVDALNMKAKYPLRDLVGEGVPV